MSSLTPFDALTPPKREDYTISKVDDYGSKGSITAWISEIGRLP